MEDRDDYPIIPQAKDFCRKNYKHEFTVSGHDQITCIHCHQVRPIERPIQSAMGKEPKKYPDFPQWLETEDGKKCLAWPISETKYLQNRLFWAFDAGRNCVWQQYTEQKKELASLKEENAKLKFRADLVSIYKQEKEDRDKILHQIKCTLYDRLTETEKLNDILKFFPTVLKTFSDNK